MRAIFLAACFLAFGAASPAAEVAPEDALAIRAVIEGQLDAFARDDATGAFALATPGIRTRFGTAAAFMDIVRTSYPVVYRPKSVQFEPAEVVEGVVVQPVRMIDAQGHRWIALYPMQRQSDGKWRIDGCQLARLAGRET